MTTNPLVKRNFSTDITARATGRYSIQKTEAHRAPVLDLCGNAVWGD